MRWARLALLLGARFSPGGADVVPPGKRCHQVGGTCRPSKAAAVRADVEPPPPINARRLPAVTAPALPDQPTESCLVASGSSGGAYLLGVGQNISLSPDQIMDSSQEGDPLESALMENTRKWVLVTIDGETMECLDTRNESVKNESVKDPCAEFLSKEDCSWTLDYGCPGQPTGALGDAGADDSTGYLCCCTKEAWKQQAGLGGPPPEEDPCDSGEVADDSVMCGLGYLDGAWGPQVCCAPTDGAPAPAPPPDTTMGVSTTTAAGTTTAGSTTTAAGTTTAGSSTAPDTTAGASSTTAADTTTADTTTAGASTAADAEAKSQDFGGALLGGRGQAGAWGAGPAEWASLAGVALLVAGLASRFGPRAARAPAERHAELDGAQLAMLHAGSWDDGSG